MIITLCLLADTFILQNCTVTSSSIGTIRVSCDSSHQILVTSTCTNNCNNPMVTSSGSSPLTMRGLDPGMMYSVIINVFDGNQVVLRGRVVERGITVMDTRSSKINYCIKLEEKPVHICSYVLMYIRTYVLMFIGTYILTYIHTCICIYMHSYVLHTYYTYIWYSSRPSLQMYVTHCASRNLKITCMLGWCDTRNTLLVSDY